MEKMTWGEVAGIIAAVAFAVLVVFIVLLLRQVSKTVKEVVKTVDQVNQTIAILRRDVDGLSVEAQGLLNKSNQLLEDINGKVEMIDPLFEAIGDVGVSVSDVNDSTRNLVLNITNKTNAKVNEVANRFKNTTEDGQNQQQRVKRRQFSLKEKIGRTAMQLKKKREIRKIEADSKVKLFNNERG